MKKPPMTAQGNPDEELSDSTLDELLTEFLEIASGLDEEAFSNMSLEEFISEFLKPSSSPGLTPLIASGQKNNVVMEEPPMTTQADSYGKDSVSSPLDKLVPKFNQTACPETESKPEPVEVNPLQPSLSQKGRKRKRDDHEDQTSARAVLPLCMSTQTDSSISTPKRVAIKRHAVMQKSCNTEISVGNNRKRKWRT